MKFGFSEEQEAFRDVLRRYFEDRSPTTEVRRLMATDQGWEREGWDRMNSELGLAAIAIPEAYGGQGFGLAEQCIALEEMGRALVCSPYFATAVLAASAIEFAGSEQQKKTLLPGIASGETVATLAFCEDDGRWDVEGVALEAHSDGTLHGTKSYVLDGQAADLVVVLARAPGTTGTDGLSLHLVRGDAAGLERRALQSIDETRRIARLAFDGVEAEPLPGAGAPAMEQVLARAAICLANEMVGGAERLRADALDYVGMRMQFGRSIASFQVTKHKAADMLLDVELARSAAYYAAAAHDEADDGVIALASLAKAGAGEAYMQTAIHAVQMHGGIGFTWDNDTHLWFKRAKVSEVFLGSSAEHRERLVAHWQD